MDRRNVYVFFVGLLLLLIENVAAWQLNIDPEHHHHIRTGAKVNILCKAVDQVVFDACHFKVKRDRRHDTDIIDLTHMPRQFDVSHVDTVELPTRYHGTGLKQGECGITMADVPEGAYIVGCRARGKEGGWKYRTMTLQVNNHETLQLKVQPEQRVVNPGGTVPILCQTSGPMSECRIETLSGKYTIETSNLQDGACRIAIPRVQIENNGPVWCRVRRDGTHMEAAAMTLIVAKPPPPPVLEVLPGATALLAGDTLTATCTVRDSRPAATMVWTLGDRVVRSDAEDDFAQPNWSWPWDLQTVRQQVTVEVEAVHDGAVLKCTAKHAASRQSKEASVVLKVAPRRRPTTAPSTTTPASTAISGPITRPPWYAPPPRPTSSPPPHCGRPIAPPPADLPSRLFDGRMEGWQRRVNRFPWSVVVYKATPREGYTLICGGTLVAPDVVISSAQCFYDERYRRINNRTHYKIAVGKYHTSYNVTDIGEQRFDIADIALHARYQGRISYYQNDIAVVRLAAAVEYTSSVNAACVDWSHEQGFLDSDELPFVEGQRGLITGYGVTETGDVSEVLRYIELPWVTTDACLAAIPVDMHSFVTDDKFCAGYLHANKSVCPGDSGSGLMFLNTTDNSFYLGGVSSVTFKPFSSHDPCYKELYTGFTLVAKHVGWIRGLVAMWGEGS